MESWIWKTLPTSSWKWNQKSCYSKTCCNTITTIYSPSALQLRLVNSQKNVYIHIKKTTEHEYFVLFTHYDLSNSSVPLFFPFPPKQPGAGSEWSLASILSVSYTCSPHYRENTTYLLLSDLKSTKKCNFWIFLTEQTPKKGPKNVDF